MSKTLALVFGAITFSIAGASGCGSDMTCGTGTQASGDECITVATAATGGSSSSQGGSDAGGGGSTGGTGAGGAEAPTLADLLEQMPPCVPVAADGRIDFDTACVDGACMGMTYAEMSAALGSAGACSAGDPNTQSLTCDWSGLSAFFADADMDGVPDPGDTATCLFLGEPFDGGTTEGLGVGATMRCFVDALGIPSQAQFTATGKGYVVSQVGWGDFGIGPAISDLYGDVGIEPDGRADLIAICDVFSGGL